MVDTSQYVPNGVAEWAEKRLPDFGYAIDVGANDGVFLSNSLKLEQKGWYVLCVEPNPMLAHKGRENRKLWVEAACGSVDADKMMTVVGEYPYASVSGFHAEESPPEMFPPGYDPQKTTHAAVRMTTLESILGNCGFPRLDFLTIDTEGHELDVLNGIYLWKWAPKIIVAEAWTEKARHTIVNHLYQFGYDLETVLEYDCCFVRAK